MNCTTPAPTSGRGLSRRPQLRALLVLVALLSCAALACGCKGDPASDEGEQGGGGGSSTEGGEGGGGGEGGEAGATGDDGAGTAGDGGDAAVVAGLSAYDAYRLDTAYVVALVDPAATTAALDAERAGAPEALQGALGTSDAALGAQWQGVESILTAAAWGDESGLDATRPLALFLATGGTRQDLGKVYVELGKGMAGIESVVGMAIDAGNARDNAGDAAVRLAADELNTKLARIGTGIRFVLPVSDSAKALAWLQGKLEGAGFTAGEASDGRALHMTDDEGRVVLVTDGGDVLVVDSAWIQALANDAEAHADASEMLVAGLTVSAESLSVELPKGALASVAIDAATFGRLDFFNAHHLALRRLEELQGVPRGTRVEPGNALVQELDQLKLTIGLLDQAVIRGPQKEFRIDVFPASDGAPLRVVTRGTLEGISGMASMKFAGLSVLPDDAVLGASVAPSMLPSSGDWASAGLDAPSYMTPEKLFKAAELGQLPAWFTRPTLMGAWMWALPSSVWRDMVPDGVRDGVDPSTFERVELVLGSGGGASVVAIDADGDPKTWTHALACAAAGKPVIGECPDDKIPAAGSTGELLFNEYPVQAHVGAGSPLITAVGSPTELVDALAMATPAPVQPALHVRLDTRNDPGLGPVGSVFGPVADLLGPWVETLTWSLEPTDEALVWTLEATGPAPLLAATHSLLGSFPGAVETGPLFSFALTIAYDVKRLELAKRVTKTAGGNSRRVAAAPVDPANKAGIAAVFNKNKGQVEKCYKRVMQKFGAGGGKLAVMVYIESDGSVKSVDVRKDQIGNGFGSCVRDKIQVWKFPPQGKLVQVGKAWSL